MTRCFFIRPPVGLGIQGTPHKLAVGVDMAFFELGERRHDRHRLRWDSGFLKAGHAAHRACSTCEIDSRDIMRVGCRREAAPPDEWDSCIMNPASAKSAPYDCVHQTTTTIRGKSAVSDPGFTPLQGQYLAFIRAYTLIHRVPPSEADMQRFFRVTPPGVHRMVLLLEERGWVNRVPAKARSLRVLVAPEALPVLEDPEIDGTR